MMELFDGVNFTLGRQASEAFSLSHHLQLPIDSEHNYFLALDHRRDNVRDSTDSPLATSCRARASERTE